MNTFGNKFRFTSFGESHGVAVGGVLDGFPSGFTIDFDYIKKEIYLRSPSSVKYATQRVEYDDVEYLSGIFNGVSLGTPIAFIIRNNNCKSDDYNHIEHIFRPGHADYTYQVKYGIRDYRGGGRASARETISRVVAGAFASQWLLSRGIEINAFVDSIGNVSLPDGFDYNNMERVASSSLRCPDLDTENRMMNLLEDVRRQGNSIGGSVSCIIKGIPAGIGNPIFGKLQQYLSFAFMSIPAAKCFEYGLGHKAVNYKGSDSNDAMSCKNGVPYFITNHAGGILGGISTGENINCRVVFKPISSIDMEQNSINDKGDNVKFKVGGRHDICAAPRAVAVVKAMAALTLMDVLL